MHILFVLLKEKTWNCNGFAGANVEKKLTWGKSLLKIFIGCYHTMLTHTGKSLTLYKDLLPGKKAILFACTNGHKECQVTPCTKFTWVAKE